jgi:hypothetical protein
MDYESLWQVKQVLYKDLTEELLSGSEMEQV